MGTTRSAQSEEGLAAKAPRLIGSESLLSCAPSGTVLEFWQWAFSDLRANSLRGIFAEWLVGKLLNLEMTVRDCWGECDLTASGGVKIEVKAAAYLQAWTTSGKVSAITFQGLKGETWTPEAGYSGVKTYNADVYVLCAQIERDPQRWNALDLSQWRFYLLTRDQVCQNNSASMGLKTVQKITEEMSAEQFSAEGKRLLAQIITSKNAKPKVTEQ